MNRILIALCCAAPALAAPAFAGSILEMESMEFLEQPPVSSTVTISTQDKLSRIDITSGSEGESGSVIYRDDRREMIAIDHEEDGYYVLDEATMVTMAERLTSARQQMHDALAEMPPEQRAMAEQMMQQHLPQATAQQVELTVRKTGQTDSINGFRCSYYEVLQQETRVRELCMTGWDDISGGREAADAMYAMAGFFETMAEAFSGGAGVDLMGEQRELFQHMRELDGYPVLAREFDENGRLESENRLKSARKASIDAGRFNAPRGYRRMDFAPD